MSINKRFKNTMTSRSSLKKKKFYEFEELSDEVIEEAKNHSFENPLYVRGKMTDWLVYTNEEGVFVAKLVLAFSSFVLVKD